MMLLSPCVSLHGAHATQRSPSGSVSFAGSPPTQSLSLPSQTSVAPGCVVGSFGPQSPPPKIVGLSPCVSLHDAHATYRSPSGSCSFAGTTPLQSLSLPSHTSLAPGC